MRGHQVEANLLDAPASQITRVIEIMLHVPMLPPNQILQ